MTVGVCCDYHWFISLTLFFVFYTVVNYSLLIVNRNLFIKEKLLFITLEQLEAPFFVRLTHGESTHQSDWHKQIDANYLKRWIVFSAFLPGSASLGIIPSQAISAGTVKSIAWCLRRLTRGIPTGKSIFFVLAGYELRSPCLKMTLCQILPGERDRSAWLYISMLIIGFGSFV